MKKINNCHHWDPVYGCGLSPQQNCTSCLNADWQKIRKDIDVTEYLQSLTKDDLLCIIKYGLRGTDAPLGVTVDDIYECIGCEYIHEKM